MEGYISTARAAEVLGSDVSYVRRLLRAKRIRGEKVGRDWLVEEKSAEEYAKEYHKPGPKPAQKPKTPPRKKRSS